MTISTSFCVFFSHISLSSKKFNRRITMSLNWLKEIEHIIKYQFHNKELLKQAFTRSSYGKEHNTNHNEVLEFLGDTVLSQVIVSRLVDRFTKVNYNGLSSYRTEEQLTVYKSKLINKKMLSSRIDKLGLTDYLIASAGDMKINIQKQSSVKADLFEAIIGAIAVDSNYDRDKLNKAIDNMLNPDSYINDDFKKIDNNYVGDLQEWYQKHGYDLPVYQFRIEENGYYCNLVFDYTNFEGKAHSKSEAKKKCAKQAINYLIDNKH